MQLYALNAEGGVIPCSHAEKQADYFCPECEAVVRLRGGVHRRNHFFHLRPSTQCRQSQKSLAHLQVQHYLFSLLPQAECFLERRFPQIKRIADVVWEQKKLIFEVQCSPISAEEVAARNRDYERQGYQVVWILHDKQFNKWKTTAAEQTLQEFPHYYTNIDAKGRGFIYDQFALYEKGVKKHRQRPLMVNLSLPFHMHLLSLKTALPKKLSSRSKKWPLFFSGDFLSLSQEPSPRGEQYLQEAIAAEFSFMAEKGVTKTGFFQKFIIRPYLLFFQILLEKACK